jgi:AcrR family transcriptional regulator
LQRKQNGRRIVGLTDRKEREKEEMRRRILDAAKALFLSVGYEKASIRGIAEAIEYSPGTIYLYFKDKNELLFQLHAEAFQLLVKELMSIAPDPSAIKRLEDMGKHYIKYAFENPELYELMFLMEAPMESLECKDEIWDDGMKAFELVKFLVADCQKEGYLTGYDIEDASLMVWSFVHGLVTLKSRRRLEMFCDSTEASLERLNRSFDVFMKSISQTKK